MGTFVLLVTFCGWHSMPCVAQWRLNVAKLERSRVLKAANDFLKEAPITITASVSPRSAGGVHDFFSEGDYWWPDPQNQNGPYIQRDGMSNPNNFVDHRRYLIRMSIQVPALVARSDAEIGSRLAPSGRRRSKPFRLRKVTLLSSSQSR